MGWGLLQRVADRARVLPLARGRLALVFAAFAVAQPAQAQDNDNAFARGEILAPILVGNEGDMDFGDITPQGTNGTVVLTPAATAVCTTTGTIIRTGTCSAARFEGDVGGFFLLRVTKPVGGQITLTGPGGATMLVNNFTFGAGPGMLTLGSNATEQRYLLWTGAFTVYVGGRLNVAGNQQPGVYNGTFTLSFNYD